MNWVDATGQVLCVMGALVFVAAGIGLLRLPDIYTRASSVATAAGIGVALVVAGAALVHPGWDPTIRAVVAIVFQVATSAVGAMAIARAAVLSRHRFSPETDDSVLAEQLD
jgi:multicomponent Na+:H+ antiporter subunit G